jgi:uncharacterized Zn-finger protein
MSTTNSKVSCSEKSVVIHDCDLPLSCPTEDVSLWSAHPKVYLPIETSGQETCPYCGTHYILKRDAS